MILLKINELWRSLTPEGVRLQIFAGSGTAPQGFPGGTDLDFAT